MTKSDLVRTLSARFRGLTRADIECAVDTIFEALTQALAAGGRVELRGFGAFSIRERAERMGRNPRTGAKVYVRPSACPSSAPGRRFSPASTQRMPKARTQGSGPCGFFWPWPPPPACRLR